MTTLDYTITVIDDATDPFYVACVGFGRRLCHAEPLANSPYCGACKARADDFHTRIELIPLVGQLAAHVRETCAGSPCQSCGDMTICGDFACVEVAEPRRLSVKARAVAALAMVLLAFALLACSDLPNNGSCTGPACYSQEGHNP